MARTYIGPCPQEQWANFIYIECFLCIKCKRAHAQEVRLVRVSLLSEYILLKLQIKFAVCVFVFLVVDFSFLPPLWDSSVGIVTLYGLDDPGIESWPGRDFQNPSIPALEPTQPPILWVPGLSWGKAAGEWRPPFASSAEIKETVELYLFSPSGSLWPVLGWTWPGPLPLPIYVKYNYYFQWNQTDFCPEMSNNLNIWKYIKRNIIKTCNLGFEYEFTSMLLI
jgi:hypothetical protein